MNWDPKNQAPLDDPAAPSGAAPEQDQAAPTADGSKPEAEPEPDQAAGAADGSKAEAEPGAGPGRSEPSLLRQLLIDLRGGLRLSLFLPVAESELCAAPGALALLVLTDLLVNLAVSYFLVGRGGGFAYSALPAFFFHLPLLLFGGYLVGCLFSRPALVTVVPVALVALSIPVELSHAVLERVALLRPMGWLEGYLDAPHYYRFFGWWLSAGLLFLARLAPAPLSRRLAALLVFALLLTPLWFYPRGDLWVNAAESGESGELELNEKVLAAQARLLDGQLAGLLPGERGTPHLYFVGFAGDASQDVFLKEVMATERLFTSRFDTVRRSVILANNPESATTLPFASASNLERTLVRLGQVMNRDEDVLVLYLTSHGSRDHELTVSNRPLELDQLTPETVRRMLQKSGIPWKVLVVSACYAGGFIEPLKDERSLIMTAADATHESFGCGYGEDMTWFGQALVDRALRNTFSFTKAFEEARETIRQWEEDQGETPSNPQLWVGKEIGPKLAAVERQLAGEREP